MKPQVKAGQEWEKADNNRQGATRIRVLDTDPLRAGNVWAGTVTKDGRVIRNRYIPLAALSNTPRGYRLVKDVEPIPECKGEEAPIPVSSTLHVFTAEGLKSIAPAPSPLAKVREALGHLSACSPSCGYKCQPRCERRDALAALAPLERALPDIMYVYHCAMPHGRERAGGWEECPECRALLEGK